MKVKKDNRVLMIDESEKDFYLSEGYDVVEFNGTDYTTVEKATGGRTYSVAEYNAIADKLELLKNSKSGAELEKVIKEFDRNEAMADLKEKGVGFPGNISNDNLKKLLEENA